MGRLVSNHSTNIEGLIKWLKQVSKEEEIKTITPGCLAKARSSGGKLTLRITRQTKEGFKLIAKRGQLIQDVYIVTNKSEKSLTEILNKNDPSRSHKKKD